MTQLEVRPQIILEDWPVAPELPTVKEPPVWEPRDDDGKLTLGLIKARGLLARPRGWIKGSLRDEKGYCMIGSLEAVFGSKRDRAERLLQHHLLFDYGTSVSIVNFNDATKTRKYQVLNVFDKAIEASRKKKSR